MQPKTVLKISSTCTVLQCTTYYTNTHNPSLCMWYYVSYLPRGVCRVMKQCWWTPAVEVCGVLAQAQWYQGCLNTWKQIRWWSCDIYCTYVPTHAVLINVNGYNRPCIWVMYSNIQYNTFVHVYCIVYCMYWLSGCACQLLGITQPITLLYS